MYACIHVCMHSFMYVRMYVCMHVHICVLMYVCTRDTRIGHWCSFLTCLYAGLNLRLLDTATEGRISKDTLAEARESKKIYLCGPPALSADLERVLVHELNVPRERVHYENWWDPPTH
jgi:predicted ferric reductase